MIEFTHKPGNSGWDFVNKLEHEADKAALGGIELTAIEKSVGIEDDEEWD